MSKETEKCLHPLVVEIHAIVPRALSFVVREDDGLDFREYVVEQVKCNACGADGIQVIDSLSKKTLCVGFPNWRHLSILNRIGIAYLVRDLSVIGDYPFLKDHVEIALNQIMRDADTSSSEV